MYLSSEWWTTVTALLVVIFGIPVYFGKYYFSKSGKFEDKNQLDELNELRIQIRNIETLPAIDKIWKYLDYVYDEKARNRGGPNPIEIKATDIAHDNEHRHELHTLLNELTKIIKKDLDVKGVCNKLMEDYRKIGNMLFILVGVLGSGSVILIFVIPILNLLHIEEPVSSYIPYLWLVLIVVVLTIIFRTISLIQKTKSIQRSYYEQRKKYLTEDVRIE